MILVGISLELTDILNSRFFLNRFLGSLNVSVIHFFVTPCLVMFSLPWSESQFLKKCDCNWTWRTHNHLVHKRTLNYLAKLTKWLSCVVSTYLCGASDCMFLSCHVRVSEWIHTLWLPECQGSPWLKQGQNLKFSDFVPAWSKEFLKIQLWNCVCDMTRTYSQTI